MGDDLDDLMRDLFPDGPPPRPICKGCGAEWPVDDEPWLGRPCPEGHCLEYFCQCGVLQWSNGPVRCPCYRRTPGWLLRLLPRLRARRGGA